LTKHSRSSSPRIGREIPDTNALSAFLGGDQGVGALLRSQPRAAIPVIVLSKFRYGIAGTRRRQAYETWLDSHCGISKSWR
jgi:hypothetical protein